MSKRSLRRQGASSDAVYHAESLGIYLPERPDTEIPSLPDDLTDLDDRDLMALFAEFTAWTDYVNAKRSIAEIDEAEASSDLDYAEVSAIVAAWDVEQGAASDRRVTIAKARKAMDEEVRKAQMAKRKAHARRKILVTMADAMDRNTFLISRELSRRIGTSDTRNRGSRWTP